MPIDPSMHDWLLTDSDPSVRVRTRVELLDEDPRSEPVLADRREIGQKGWAARILGDQQSGGHWENFQGNGDQLYSPKYIATNWRLIVLAELGMTREDPRVDRAAQLLLRTWAGGWGAFGDPNGEVCVTGNCARMLLNFGYRDHPLVASSLRWLVGAQKPDGGWHCFESATGTLDAWEAMAAFAELSPAERSPEISRSIERGAEFYLERGLLRETDGSSYPPWRTLHYPNHYYYDLLVGLRLLTRLGYGHDPRLRPALDLLESKRHPDGRWRLEAVHPDLEPDDEYHPRPPVYSVAVEALDQPSRWLTVGALSVLKAAGRS